MPSEEHNHWTLCSLTMQPWLCRNTSPLLEPFSKKVWRVSLFAGIQGILWWKGGSTMENKQTVSCNRTAYSVDHNVIHEAGDQGEAVIDAYQEEAEWAERQQAAVKPDFITQKI